MIYELIAHNTDQRYPDDIRYRGYTSSKKKADLFSQIPKIQFTDSGHGIVFNARLHKGKRKPEIRELSDYVWKNLCILKEEDRKRNTPKRAKKAELGVEIKRLEKENEELRKENQNLKEVVSNWEKGLYRRL